MTTSRYALLCGILLSALLFNGHATKGQTTDTFWAWARIEVNTTTRTAGGDEKHEFRVYVSNLIAISAEDWNKLHLSLRAGKNVSEYFDATVVKAAQSRGEELDYYDTDVEWDCTCVGTANEARLKSEVEKTRNDVIETAKGNGHPVVFFNWDPTGKNKEQDLANEMKKGKTGKPGE